MSDSTRQPNVLFIICDDLGYGDVGCFGGQYDTPALDALAAEGVRLTDAHSAGVVCTPSRASVLTGRYPRRTGVDGVITVKDRELGINTDEVTFAELLREQGYATACIGKWHLGFQDQYHPLNFGFDRFRGYLSGNIDFHSHYDLTGVFDWWHDWTPSDEPGYVTDLITQHAEAFIREHADRPWCCYVGHEAPHFPYQGPNDPPERDEKGAHYHGHGRRREDPEAYREMIERLDAGVGALTRALRELGLERDTLVIFTADHGAPLNAPGEGHNAPLRGGKSGVYEGGIRVPTMARWPGVLPAGASCDEPINGTDWLPTLAGATGMRVPDDRPIDGIDLMPALSRGQTLPERVLGWQGNWRPEHRAVRRGPWKLIEQPAGEQSPASAELFNLEQDPREQHDLAQAHPDRVDELRRLGDALDQQVEAGEPVRNNHQDTKGTRKTKT